LPYHHGEMKKFKKSILKFEKMAIPPQGNEKIEICHENLK
jgi:hypothetical protein